jgi:dienelactone hydrolase
MKKLISIILVVLAFNVHAESIKFNNHTVDIYTKEKPSPTILYIPGCNGLDDMGQKYQTFHREEFKKVFPEANFVIIQMTNDLSQGATDGRCHWNDMSDDRLKRYQSWHQAAYIVKLASFIKEQSWSNGDIHVFGFSYGGRIGLWLSGSTIGKPDVFKSVSLIWPLCRPSSKAPLGSMHTPTRIWATEKDPLSDAWNCHDYYTGDTTLLNVTLYEGKNHSWFTHPSITGGNMYWPTHKTWVYSKFDQKLFDKTITDWKKWIDQF